MQIGDAEERVAFRPTTPLPQRRKINCILQNACVEKAAWWAAGCYAGLVLKAASAKSIALRRKHAPKNLRGGLRGAKWGWRLKYKSCT